MTTSSSKYLSLFNGQTSNATGGTVLYTAREQLALLYVNGNIGGGSLNIQIKPVVAAGYITPTFDFVNLAGGSNLTEVEAKALTIPAFCEVRAVLSGATSPNLDVGIFYQ
ncbi:MAG: hypothetical protein AAF621_00570 [Pseudomonadota bacterium]